MYSWLQSFLDSCVPVTLEEHVTNTDTERKWCAASNLPKKGSTLHGDTGKPEPWSLVGLNLHHHSHFQKTLLALVNLRSVNK